MNRSTFGRQFVRQMRGGAVVTGHPLAFMQEITRQGAHADAADSQKIDILKLHPIKFYRSPHRSSLRTVPAAFIARAAQGKRRKRRYFITFSISSTIRSAASGRASFSRFSLIVRKASLSESSSIARLMAAVRASASGTTTAAPLASNALAFLV